MKRAYIILALAASVLHADALSDVLQRMDQSAKVFRSLSADFHKTTYSDTLSDTTQEDGNFQMMKRPKSGVVLLGNFFGKDARKMHLAGNQLEMYYPKANSVDIVDTRKFTKSVDQFLLVGFGTSTAELKKTYNITLGGSETINGVKTTRLDLTPIKEEVKKLFNTIQIWIPDGEGNPIQEKVLSGKQSKDYTLFLFSNRKIRTTSDPPLPDSDFELNLPAGVKRNNVGK